MNLGVDIGRVIIAPEVADGEDTSFFGRRNEDVLATPPNQGVYEVLPELVQLFGGRVWLVSKARQRVQEKTRQWLSHQRFFERTGIPPHNFRFCDERAEKANHCRELGITHFIDDREDVLLYLEGIVKHRFLFGPQSGQAPSALVPVESWYAVRKAIAATLRPNPG